MKVVNIHEAKTHLSRLVEESLNGEPFIIAKAGKPMVQVVRLEPPKEMEPFGFLRGKAAVPDDFNTMMEKEIEAIFYGSDWDESE
ncbi:MAG: type II toxin-antitoxin system Phd/YefM family antitoxin [Streptosporangiaceae bacterium]